MSMPPPPRVRCGPIELRMITPRTAPQLFALAREPELSRHLQWSAHATMDDSLEYVHDTRALWERGRAWLPGIFDRERAQLVGCTGISSIDRPNRRAEVGTWIGIPFQRSGRNLHAKAAVATVAFELLDLTRLEFLCRVDNEASLESMRRLPGIREEGVLSERIVCDDVAFDAVMFALLKSDFDPAAYPPVELL